MGSHSAKTNRVGGLMRLRNLVQKQWRGLFLLPIAIIAVGCGEDLSPEDTTPPVRPAIIPKSDEDQFLEQGIDSHPGYSEDDYWIIIEWEWNDESDLRGYYVYRSDERDTLMRFDRIKDLRLGVDLTREADPNPYYIDQDPALGPDQVTGYSHGFYYFIRAYDYSGNTSSHSDTVYYRLLPKPRALRISGNTASVFNFIWDYYSQDNWNYFYIRVYPQGFPDTRVWSYKAELLGAPFSVVFNTDGSAEPDFFYPGTDSLMAGSYAWVADVVADFDALHPAGAETRSGFSVNP
jgi:hypothetical protein